MSGFFNHICEYFFGDASENRSSSQLHATPIHSESRHEDNNTMITAPDLPMAEFAWSRSRPFSVANTLSTNFHKERMSKERTDQNTSSAKSSTTPQLSSMPIKRKLEEDTESTGDRASKLSRFNATRGNQHRHEPINVKHQAQRPIIQQAPIQTAVKNSGPKVAIDQRTKSPMEGSKQAAYIIAIKQHNDQLNANPLVSASKPATPFKSNSTSISMSTPARAQQHKAGLTIDLPINAAVATTRPRAKRTCLGFFNLPRELRDMIYLDMISTYTVPSYFGDRRTVDGTTLKIKLLLISHQFGEEYADLFLKLKTFRLIVEHNTVTSPPMLFNSPHRPQAPLHIFRHVELTIKVGDWRDCTSVVGRKQKRKAETVASALSHTLGKMRCLETVKVMILIADRTLEKGFRKVFEEEGFESICPAWGEVRGRKELEVILLSRM